MRCLRPRARAIAANTSRRARVKFVTLLILILARSAALGAQDNPATLPAAHATAKPDVNKQGASPAHKFWDTENIGLFTGVGAARMLDYASTRYLRDQGNDEWLLTNSIVDNRPLFVGIELAGTAASIGVSYLFHRSGHHTLERWVSIAHIGVGAGGSVRNYLLKPPQVIYAQPAAIPGTLSIRTW
jgi:hypothetical protein